MVLTRRRLSGRKNSGRAIDPPPHPVEELRERYTGHPASERSLWSEEYVAQELDLATFRADNAYVWQRFSDDDTYRRSYAWLAEHEPTLLARCHEDGAFGARTVTVDGQLVSRDLLDSVAELGFLTAELGNLAGLSALDIGAGYGRLAHRASETVPALSYACTDGIPESTFLSRLYLSYRGSKASVVPLDEVLTFASGIHIDLAINVHSFPECTWSTIEWWLRTLAEHDVRFLFLVPNEIAELLTTEQNGDRLDFSPLIRKFGYRLETMRLKYRKRGTPNGDWLFQDSHLLYVRA